MRRPLLTLVLGAASLACSASSVSSPTAGDAGTPPTAVAQFLGRLREAFCGAIEPCCNAHALPFDAAGCSTERGVTEGDAVARGAVVRTDAIDACLARAAEWATACGASPSQARAYEEACARVLSGPKAVGEPCKVSLECAQPSAGEGYVRCLGDRTGTTVCMLALPPTAGLACRPAAPSFSDCDEDEALYCAGTGRCEPRRALGAPCADTGGCLAGGSCQGTPGTCVAQAATGGACNGYEDGCIDARACNGSTKTCDPRLGIGARCARPDECGSQRCDGTCIPHGLAASTARCGG